MESNGWEKWREHILSELRRLGQQEAELKEHITNTFRSLEVKIDNLVNQQGELKVTYAVLSAHQESVQREIDNLEKEIHILRKDVESKMALLNESITRVRVSLAERVGAGAAGGAGVAAIIELARFIIGV